MPSNFNQSNKEDNLLSFLLFKYLPYWPLFAIFLFICLVGAWGYLQTATPVYEAYATLIIKDEKKGVDDSKIMEPMNAFSSKKIIENEIEVIKSRALMRRVVNDLCLYAPVFEDKGITKQVPAYTLSPIRIEVKNPESIIESQTKPLVIYFSYDFNRKEVKISDKNYPINTWIKSPYGLIKFTANKEQRYTGKYPLYFTLIHPKNITNGLVSNLEAIPSSKLSTVINLKLKDPVPQRGEDILNHLILSYNDLAITERNKLAANTLTFIEDRIKAVKSELDEVEKDVQKYKSNQGVVDLSEQGKLYLRNVGDNDRKISDLNLQLAVLDKVEKYVISKDNKTGIVPSTLGIKDEVLSQLLERLYDSELEYEKLRKTTAENNPILVSIINEIEKIRPSILENVQSQRANLLAGLANASTTNNKYNSAIQTIPQKERELLEISRNRAIKNELYSFLLEKREETALSYAPSAGDSRIVDTAESSMFPVSPQPIVIYAMAIFVAFGIGIALITGKEMFNTKILFRSEIEKYTIIPVIGEISDIEPKKKQVHIGYQTRLILEQFRDLRMAMGLYGRTLQKRKILVTSSIEGEGKSFISENLAKSLAASDKKVVLINFDLRKPQISGIFDVEDNKGLAEYLSGDLEPYELVKITKFNNLFIVPAGQASLESSNVLIDVELTALFAYLEDLFDFVIVDTPPVEIALDACLLARYCDTSLFVTRHGHTPKVLMQRIDQDKNIQFFKNIAIVFNGVKNRGFINNRYGYNYGYNQRKKAYYSS